MKNKLENIIFYNGDMFKQINRKTGTQRSHDKYINRDGLIIGILKSGEIRESYGNFNKSGYLVTHANIFKKKTATKVHRLVAMLFSDEVPDNYMELDVEHLNCDKLDNRISNLRFSDRKTNMNNSETIARIRMNTTNINIEFDEEGRILVTGSETYMKALMAELGLN